MWKSLMPTHSRALSHSVLKNMCAAGYASGDQGGGAVFEFQKEGEGRGKPLLCPWEPPRLGAKSLVPTSATASIWPDETWTWPPGLAQTVCSSNHISAALTSNVLASQKLWEYLKVQQYLLKLSHLKGIYRKIQDWLSAQAVKVTSVYDLKDSRSPCQPPLSSKRQYGRVAKNQTLGPEDLNLIPSPTTC